MLQGVRIELEPPAHVQLAVDDGQVVAQRALAHAERFGNDQALGAAMLDDGVDDVALARRQRGDTRRGVVASALRRRAAAAAEQHRHQCAIEPGLAAVHALDRLEHVLGGLRLQHHAACAAQPEIEQQHVGARKRRMRQQFLRARRRADDRHARLHAVDELLQPPQRDRVVVGEEHADRRIGMAYLRGLRRARGGSHRQAVAVRRSRPSEAA